MDTTIAKMKIYKTKRIFNIERESYGLLHTCIDGHMMTDHGEVEYFFVDRGPVICGLVCMLCAVCYEMSLPEFKGE
jgi:hypothetical protein